MLVVAILVAVALPTVATAIPPPDDRIPAPAPSAVCRRSVADPFPARVADACMRKCGIEHRRCKATASGGACADAYVACMEAC